MKLVKHSYLLFLFPFCHLDSSRAIYDIRAPSSLKGLEHSVCRLIALTCELGISAR